MPTKRRRARLAAAGACCLGAILLAGCHASATVAIRVDGDGKGTVAVTVTVDRAARLALAGAELHPGALASADVLPHVRLTDLSAHGWTVSAWRPTRAGGATIRLSKPFSGTAGLASVLGELDGPAAVHDVTVVRQRSLLHDRDSVAFVADLRHLSPGVAGDAALAGRLRAAGIDVAALDAGLGSTLRTAFDLTVRVDVPNGGHVSVRVPPGEERAIAAGSTSDHPGRVTALAAAAAAAFAGLVCFVLAAWFAARARRRARVPYP